MKDWEKIALNLLHESLNPIPHEKNELDWKADLSEKTEKLAHHLCAFANTQGGGFLAFGVDDNGSIIGIREKPYQETIKKLGNIARQNIIPGSAIDYTILTYQGHELLLVYVKESQEKPVHLRSGTIYDSYTRSAGQTRKMTKLEVAQLIARSSGASFEEESALSNLTSDDVIKRLDVQSYFDLLSMPLPQTNEAILDRLTYDKIVRKDGDSLLITNLGAILFAKDLREFDHLQRKSVRVIIYDKTDRLQVRREYEEKHGYASGFEGLINYISNQLPTNEIIEQALRKEVKMYPDLAIRELVANAIIHQDFSTMGTGPMVEIFSDRIEITNPGKPLINTMRFIDSPPQSRNELLASFMRRANICEERGSGIDKVIFQVELYQLPAPNFIETDNHLRVVLYAYRPLAKMEKGDRIRACYQHCCLKYVSGQRMSNQTLRERFSISEANYPMASRIIADTIKAKFVKPSEPESKSKKYATYLPYWG